MFFKAASIRSISGIEHYVELYKNPNDADIDELKKQTKLGIRFVVVKQVVYAFIADVLHEDIKKAFNIDYDFSFTYDFQFDSLLIMKGPGLDSFRLIRGLFPNLKAISIDGKYTIAL
jgi:hypothetical protein